jgi:NAD(P)-dependent dehydrogenase (short-subunit alcohol dehydrogenase family)
MIPTSSLKGSVIVVTGGEGLLGSAIVAACREAGATAISADISVKEASDGTKVHMDIANEASIRSAIGEIWKRHGRIDGLVNAAYPRTKDWRLPFEQVPAASFRENLAMHLLGYTLCCREVLERMKEKRAGSVVNVASIYGVVAPDFSLYEGTSIETSPAAYAAIKGGLLQMTRYLASYYGRHNLRVNAISPGGVENDHPADFAERYARKTPLGRMARPEDIAPAAVFLLSDGARYITGVNLPVDGGWTAVGGA